MSIKMLLNQRSVLTSLGQMGLAADPITRRPPRILCILHFYSYIIAAVPAAVHSSL